MRRASFIALALGLVGFVAESAGQVQPKGPPPKPQVVYASFRELMAEGRYDLAASYLQAFLDASPTDSDFLEIEKKYGSTAFTQLRNVPKWSDDAAVEKKARANVEEVVKRARAANEKVLRDPARIAKYIANLGASYEERVFAEIELRRLGDYVVPFLFDQLRVTRDNNLHAGILSAIKAEEGVAIPAWIASLDALPPEKQIGVVTAIAGRDDALRLLTYAQSDLTPFLWKVIAQTQGNESPALRRLAEDLLQRLSPGTKIDFQQPQARLVAIARTFYDHQARFAATRKNPDGSPTTVPVWTYDAKADKLVKAEEVPIGNAEEYFGLRYARWALEGKPDYELAQGLILALAAERAIERIHFGYLATGEPATYRLLADAPSATLTELLNFGLNRKRTALVISLLQVLGDRADRDVATPPAGKPPRPSLLARALSYPDPQVQLAAANALLRSPVPVPTELRGTIVDILRRAAGADAGAPNAKGTALLADPDRARSDATALLLRGLGYNVEIFRTGRDLARRIARASDFDVILIDQHTPSPLLIDLVGELRADSKAANRPILVIASGDKPRMPTYDQLLVRFAALIAATELRVADIPPVYVFDPRDSREVNEKNRRARQQLRDAAIRTVFLERLGRLRRVVDATGLRLSETQKRLFDLRMELITAAVLATENPITPESSPDMAEQLAGLKRQIALQPPSDPYGVGPPTTDLIQLMERFETDLKLRPGPLKRVETIYSQVHPADLGLPVQDFREPEIEARLARTLRNYPEVKIIPQPFSAYEMAEDLRAAYADATQAPRDPAVKVAAQRIALEWLTKMATGARSGFEVKSAEPELRAALRVPALTDIAIDGVAAMGTAPAQQDLLTVALTGGKGGPPLATRVRAADATIRSIQVDGKLIPRSLIDPLNEAARTEPDALLRGKFETLKGLLDYRQADYVNELKSFSPPLLPPPPPAKEPPKEPAPKR